MVRISTLILLTIVVLLLSVVVLLHPENVLIDQFTGQSHRGDPNFADTLQIGATAWLVATRPLGICTINDWVHHRYRAEE